MGAAVIAEVAADSPAARAGVQREDVLQDIDGQEIKDNEDLSEFLWAQCPGDTVRLSLMRKGRILQPAATLSA